MTGPWHTEALDLFHTQVNKNDVYGQYVKALGVNAEQVESIADIPFLPIEFFRTHEVKSGSWPSERVFKSSGTTGSIRSTHHVRSISEYVMHAKQIFSVEIGPPADYVVIALLPGYAPESSLVTMIDHFIECSIYKESGFFDDHKSFASLVQVLRHCREQKLPAVLFGVTHSLLQFVEVQKLSYPELIVIETGGMKGRGPEWTRFEVHERIKKALDLSLVYSEYGMTELLSQAYSHGDGLFRSNRSLKVLPGDLYDPLEMVGFGENCRLNIIDLANKETCGFISTADIGRVYADGSFEVLGRLDHAELRGCNLLFAG